MKKERGFTLVELIMAIAIIGIMATFAVPNMRAFIANGRLVEATNDFVSAVGLAKTEAIRLRRTVNVSATTANATNDWGGGWRIWTDADGSGSTTSANNLIKEFSARQGDVVMDQTTNVTVFQFSPKGIRRDTAGSVLISVCDSRTGERGKQITVSTLGSVSVNGSFTCS